MRSLIVLFLSATCLACQEPTIDASTPESAKASMDSMHESLPPEKREEFQSAVQEVIGDKMKGALGTAFLAALSGTEVDPETMAANMLEPLDGMNADQIIAQAEQLRFEREAREREQIAKEIRELQDRKAASEAARQQLAAFQVQRSRFYKRERRFTGSQPAIELAVHNGTEHAISRAYFKGTLATPGRSVPWLVEDFNYSIRGGLEPGESAEWNLAPNMFSAWGNVEEREDMVFTVEVVKLDGPDGETLFESNWSEKDEKRLSTLVAAE